MSLRVPYNFLSSRKKRDALLACAMEDSFFAPIAHDLIDYGYEITFSFSGGAGAYQPFALATEVLDMPEKQQMFSKGFERQVEAGVFKAIIRLSVCHGYGGHCHSFFHELMHFYQDMLGLYLLPLKERGVMPVMADLRTSITALLFCEAWAEVEALRTCWAFGYKGADKRPWEAAVRSRGRGALARYYGQCLDEGADEAVAAARAFERWYQGAHRLFYERHAARIYESEMLRLMDDVALPSERRDFIAAHLRGAPLSILLEKIPQDVIPRYFAQIDMDCDIFNEPRISGSLSRFCKVEDCFWSVSNTDVHEIKCASPPYLWRQLRQAEIQNAEVPPHIG